MSNKILFCAPALVDIFNRQAARLIDNKFHHLAGDNDHEFLLGLEQLGRTIGKMGELEFHKDALPLLIVISRRIVNLQYQMSKATFSRKRDFVDSAVLTNTPAARHDLYVVFDIEIGHGRKEGEPTDYADSFNIRGRRGLNLEEAAALLLHEKQLFHDRRYLYLLGADEQIIRSRDSTRNYKVTRNRVYPALVKFDNGPGLVYSNPGDNTNFYHSVPSRSGRDIFYHDFAKNNVTGIRPY